MTAEDVGMLAVTLAVRGLQEATVMFQPGNQASCSVWRPVGPPSDMVH